MRGAGGQVEGGDDSSGSRFGPSVPRNPLNRMAAPPGEISASFLLSSSLFLVPNHHGQGEDCTFLNVHVLSPAVRRHGAKRNLPAPAATTLQISVKSMKMNQKKKGKKDNRVV